jgi:hypothetical protein
MPLPINRATSPTRYRVRCGFTKRSSVARSVAPEAGALKVGIGAVGAVLVVAVEWDWNVI